MLLVNSNSLSIFWTTTIFSYYVVLDTSGWRISDGSIKDGLQNTCLFGRSQFLTSKEAAALGLPKATIMLDGGLFLFLFVSYPFYLG